ncbi:hypothetical protein [Chromobacterium sp. CV08]|uniref:hypothetical protein n=1 Tax=Chromobacterium sp. CV08 TaxID=3133274 RepID=UPI003DAA0D74
MRKWTAMAGIALACSSAAQAQTKAPDGAYGFDWHGDTPCRKMDQAALRRFQSCEDGGSGFGDGVRPLLTCRHGKNDEWVIYASKAQCRDARATMEANAP